MKISMPADPSYPSIPYYFFSPKMKKKSLQLLQSLPPEYQRYARPNSNAVIIEGAFGSLITQQIKDHNWVLSWLDAVIKTPVRVQPFVVRPMVSLLCTIEGNTLSGKLEGIGKLQLISKRLTVFYLPARAESKVQFEKGHYRMMYISIGEDLLKTFAAFHPQFQQLYEWLMTGYDNPKLLTTFELTPAAYALLEQIQDISESDPTWKLFVGNKVMDFLRLYFSYLINHDNGVPVNDRKMKMEEAISYIRSNFYKPLIIPVLAKMVGMNVTTFEREFKRFYQQTPREFIQGCRIRQSVTLLIDSDLPVNDIALSVGFSVPNFFSRIFKKHYEMSPMQYRKKWKSATNGH